MKTVYLFLSFVLFFLIGCGPSFQLSRNNTYTVTTDDIKELTFGGGIFRGGVIVAGVSLRNTSKHSLLLDAGPYAGIELKGINSVSVASDSSQRTYAVRPGDRVDFVVRTYLRSDQWFRIDFLVSSIESDLEPAKLPYRFTDSWRRGFSYKNYAVYVRGNRIVIK